MAATSFGLGVGIVDPMVLSSPPRLRTIPLGIAAGLKMQIDFSRHKKLWLGLYEIELNRYIKKLCRPGYNSFDVGGQSGYDALILAKLSGGKVISFEVDQEACAEMKATFAANVPLADRLSAICCFVDRTSDETGGTKALDDIAFAEDGFVPDFIKLDIEGGELAALEGSQRILAERRPHLIVETHSEEIDSACADLLRSHGYDPFPVEQRRWLRDHRPVGFNRWLVAEGKSKS